MIGLKPEVSLFVRGNRNKEYQFWGQRSPWEDEWSDATTLGEEAEPGLRTAVGVTRCIETFAETPGKSGNNFGQEDKVPASQAVQNPASL